MKTFIKISLVFLLVYPKTGFSQDTTKMKNSIYLELFGTGYYYSFNYERTLFNKNKSTFNLRIGLNWHPFTYHAGGGSNVHLGISYIYSFNQKINIEAGMYPDLWIVYKPIPETQAQRNEVIRDPQSWGLPFQPPFKIYVTALVGLRYNLNKKWFLRGFYCPYISLFPRYSISGKDFYYLNWGGISIGKYF